MPYELISAFSLGILVAINPCQLSISISAITYLMRKENGSGIDAMISTMLYAAGRSITYTVLGWIMMCLVGGGKNIQCFSEVLSKAEIILPYILIVLGVFFIYRAVHHHEHHGDSCHNSGQIIRRNGPLGSLFLGMTLALAFCPESAVFYFGILLPMSISSNIGIILPFTFALAASIPVIGIAFIMNKAVKKIHSISHTFEHLQRILNGITGVIFFVIAFFLMLE